MFVLLLQIDFRMRERGEKLFSGSEDDVDVSKKQVAATSLQSDSSSESDTDPDMPRSEQVSDVDDTSDDEDSKVYEVCGKLRQLQVLFVLF